MSATPESSRTGTIAVIVGIIALILGCCGGLFMGGAVAFLIARQAAPVDMAPVERFSLPDLPEMPEIPQMPDLPELPAVPELGMSGAFVREVIADSPADEAGLRVGDLIMRVDDVPLDANHRLADIIAAYEPGDQVVLQVLRGERSLSLQVTLGDNDQGEPFLGIRYVDMFRERQAPTD